MHERLLGPQGWEEFAKNNSMPSLNCSQLDGLDARLLIHDSDQLSERENSELWAFQSQDIVKELGKGASEAALHQGEGSGRPVCGAQPTSWWAAGSPPQVLAEHS